jgi:perosamine synthetase
MGRNIRYGRQCILEDDVSAVVAQLKSDWLTQGPTVESFEKAICEKVGAKYCVAVSSGTAALHLACMAAGVGPGDYGITSAITFVASANCMLYCGANARVADVFSSTALIDIESVRELVRIIGEPPKVIIPVDFAGQTGELEAIYEQAKKWGAFVIQDAAHSLGASYRVSDEWFQVGACAHSDMTILSFHPVKHITTGEGGAICTNDQALAEKLRLLRSHGITRNTASFDKVEGPWCYNQVELGYHYRLTDIQAALGISQLSKLDNFVKIRRELADHYHQGLAQEGLLDFLTPLTQYTNSLNSYHIFPVCLKNGLDKVRLDLFNFLESKGIHAQVHYIPVHYHSLHQSYLLGQSLQRAEEYYRSCITLPLHVSLSLDDIGYIIESLKVFFRNRI